MTKANTANKSVPSEDPFGRKSGGASKTGKPVTTDPSEFVTERGADKRLAYDTVPDSAKRDGDEFSQSFWKPVIEETPPTHTVSGSHPTGSQRTAYAKAVDIQAGKGDKAWSKKRPQGLRTKPEGPLPN